MLLCLFGAVNEDELPNAHLNAHLISLFNPFSKKSPKCLKITIPVIDTGNFVIFKSFWFRPKKRRKLRKVRNSWVNSRKKTILQKIAQNYQKDSITILRKNFSGLGPKLWGQISHLGSNLKLNVRWGPYISKWRFYRKLFDNVGLKVKWGHRG